MWFGKAPKTSFLFLSVMWKSGVVELRSADPMLEVTDEWSDMAVGMEDVPSSSGLGSNPLCQQSSNDSQLVELELHAYEGRAGYMVK